MKKERISWDCLRCGHPALCSEATNETNEWMTNVVVLFPSEQFVKGRYDGYGNIITKDGELILIGGFVDPCLWHDDCWETWHRKVHDLSYASQRSADNGWGFEDGAHDKIQPYVQSKTQTLERLEKEAVVMLNRFERDGRREERLLTQILPVLDSFTTPKKLSGEDQRRYLLWRKKVCYQSLLRIRKAYLEELESLLVDLFGRG